MEAKVTDTKPATFFEALLASQAENSSDRLNINISAYRVLYILLLLVNHRALGLVDLNRHLCENPLIGRTYNSETMTKYINTLRRAGCDIPKSSSRNDFQYVLESSPFRLSLSSEEITVAEKILTVLSGHPDESLLSAYHDFLGELQWSLPETHRFGRDYIRGPMDHDDDLRRQHRRELVRRYRRYCKEAQWLVLTYIDAAFSRQGERIVEPIRVIEEKGRIYLLATEHESVGWHDRLRLDLEKITTVRQLPSKVSRQAVPMTVVFQVYGRLAKTYRLYAGETVMFEKEDALQIKARTDEGGKLLARLRKYGQHCQVISPARLRKGMRHHARQLLALNIE